MRYRYECGNCGYKDEISSSMELREYSIHCSECGRKVKLEPVKEEVGHGRASEMS